MGKSLEHQSLVLEMFGANIDTQSDSHSGGFQIVQGLGAINAYQLILGLQYQNDLV